MSEVNDTTEGKLESAIKLLADKAGQATDSPQAMQFSQAALNLAHTKQVLKEAK